RNRTGAGVETDEQGRFSLWVDPGGVEVEASADGYAPGREWGHAPGRFEILLTPESSLAGTVVDAATNQPVAGARVTLDSGPFEDGVPGSDITDADGKFRVEPLTP